MDVRIRTILVSAGTFIGVLLLMCLVAGVMMQSEAQADKDYQQALDKLGGIDSQDTGDPDVTVPDDGNKEPDAKDVTGSPESGQQAGVTDISEPADETVADPADETIPGPADETIPETGTDPTKNPSSARVVVIDAAHQSKDNSDTEPIGPGASEKKIKAHVGATGVSSGVPEYKVNLAIAKYLREELEKRGYEVYMIRESDDVDISDAERAKTANEKGDIAIHIHCNADEREGIKGILTFYPSKTNPYAGKYSDSCLKLSEKVLKGLEDATGDNSWGCVALDNQTALNWTTIPATHVEVGYLSNPDEDFLLQTDSYRRTIAEGLADGIDLFFEQ